MNGEDECPIDQAFDCNFGELQPAGEWISGIDDIVSILDEYRTRMVPARNVSVWVAKRVCGMFGRDSFLGDRAMGLCRGAEGKVDAQLWADTYQLMADARGFSTIGGHIATPPGGHFA